MLQPKPTPQAQPGMTLEQQQALAKARARARAAQAGGQPAAPQAASPAPVGRPAPDQMPWGDNGQAFADLHTPKPGSSLATTAWEPGEARGMKPPGTGFGVSIPKPTEAGVDPMQARLKAEGLQKQDDGVWRVPSGGAYTPIPSAPDAGAMSSPQAMRDRFSQPTPPKPAGWEGPLPDTPQPRSVEQQSRDNIVQKWADYLYARRISETRLQRDMAPGMEKSNYVETARPFNIAGMDINIAGNNDKLWQQAQEAAERSGWTAPPRASQWNAAETVLNDLSLGFSDEIGGAIRAAGSYLSNLPQGADAAAKAADDTYTQHRDDANFTFNIARQDRPAEVVGGNVATMLVPAVGATKAGSMLQGASTGNRLIDTSRRIGAQTTVGAGLGALYGVGTNHPGNPSDLETTTLFGAAAGAGFATLAPVIGASFKKLDSLLDAKSRAFRSLPEPQQREIVQNLAAQGLDPDAIVNTIRTGRTPTAPAAAAAAAAAAQPSPVPVAQPTVPQAPRGGAQPGATGAGQQAAGAVPPAGPATLQASPTVVPQPQNAAALARSDAKIIRRLLVAGGVARNDVDRLLGDMVEAFNRSNDPRSRLAFFAEEYLPQQLPKEVADDVIQKLRGFGRERFGANSPRDPSRAIMRSNIGELRGSQREYLTDEFESLLGKETLMNKQGKITRDKQGVAEAVYAEEIGRQQRLLADGLATPEQMAARDDLLLLMGREDFFKQVPAELHLKAADEGKSLWEFIHQNPLEAAHWMQSELGVLARKGNTIAQAMRMPLVRRLEDAVPGYRGARLEYGDLSGQQAALEFGDDLYRVAASKFDTDNKALEFKKLSPAQRTVAKKSIRDKLLNEFRKAKTGDQQAAVITAMQKDGVLDALETILGPDGKKVADAIRAMVRENEQLRAVDLLSGSNTADNLAQQAAAREAVRSPINKSIGALGDEASYLQSGFADVVSVALGLPPVWTASKLGTKAVSKFGTPSKKKLASATRTLYGSPPRNALNVEPPPPPAPRAPKSAAKPRTPKPPVTQEDLDALLAQYDKTPTPAIRNKIIAARKALGQASSNKLKAPPSPPSKKPPPGTTSSASPTVTGIVAGGIGGAMLDQEDPARGAIIGATGLGTVAGLGNKLSKMGSGGKGPKAPTPKPAPVGAKPRIDIPIAANDGLPKGQMTPAEDLAMARAFTREPLTVDRAEYFIVMLRGEKDLRTVMDILDIRQSPTMANIPRGRAMIERTRDEVLKRSRAFLDAARPKTPVGAKPGKAPPAAQSPKLSVEPTPPVVRPDAPANGLRAYHGSPNDFDRFALTDETIGTGEGAQSYGHGLYFAENPQVGQTYRSGLSGVDTYIDGQPFDYTNPIHLATQEVRSRPWGDVSDAIGALQYQRKSASAAERKVIDAAIRHLKKGGEIGKRSTTPRGYLYEVEIAADRGQLLDLDAPLANQSESVKAGLAKLEERFGVPMRQDEAPLEYFYRIEAKHGSRAPQKISETLKGAGVPGSVFLDKGSRATGDGTRNFVIFDDSRVSLRSKEGPTPPKPTGGKPPPAQAGFGGGKGPPKPPAQSKPKNALNGIAGRAAVGGALGAALVGDAEGQGDSQAQLRAIDEAIAKLEADKQFFATATPKEIQERLRREGFNLGRAGADGKIGPDTAAAIAKYKAEIDASLERERGRRASVEAQIAYEATRPNAAQQAWREVAPWAGAAAGIGLGLKLRAGAAAKSVKQAPKVIARANKLLTPAPIPSGTSKAAKAAAQEAVNAQAGKINEFWRMGGAGENVPFKPTSKGEWRPRPKAKPASDLFPEKIKRRWNAADTGFVAGGLAESVVSGQYASELEGQLEEARILAKNSPTEANLARVQNLEDLHAAAVAASRLGLMLAGSRVVGALKYPYASTRPNVAGAEAELARLLQYIEKARK